MCLASFFGGRFVKAGDAVEKAKEGLAALGGGGGKAGEDFPGAGAVGGAVAAGEFAGDDGGPQLAFGEVVGGIDGAMIEEGEEVVALFAEAMGNGFLDGIVSGGEDELVGRVIERTALFAEIGRREGWGGGFELLGAEKEFAEVAKERRLALRMPLGGLADGLVVMGVAFVLKGRDPVVDRETVADENAGEAGAEDFVDDVTAAALANDIDGETRMRVDPQPPFRTTDPPAGFVGVDGRRATDLGDQTVVGAVEFAGQAVAGLHQTAGGQRQTEQVLEDPTGFSGRQAVMLVEVDGRGQCPRTQMSSRRPRGCRHLQGMRGANLAAARTLADMRDQARDVGTNGRKVLEKLFDGFDTGDRPAALRTGSQRNRDLLVDVIGSGPTRPRMAFAPTGLLGIRRALVLGNAKRRRLPKRRALRFLQLLLQLGDPLVGLLNPLLRLIALLAQRLILLLQPLILPAQQIDQLRLIENDLDQLLALPGERRQNDVSGSCRMLHEKQLQHETANCLVYSSFLVCFFSG